MGRAAQLAAFKAAAQLPCRPSARGVFHGFVIVFSAWERFVQLHLVLAVVPHDRNRPTTTLRRYLLFSGYLFQRRMGIRSEAHGWIQAGSQADRSSREGIREKSKDRRGRKQREHEKAISKKHISLRNERTGP